jgi:hypothetical protein
MYVTLKRYADYLPNYVGITQVLSTCYWSPDFARSGGSRRCISEKYNDYTTNAPNTYSQRTGYIHCALS